MVLRPKPRESRSLPVQPRTLRNLSANTLSRASHQPRLTNLFPVNLDFDCFCKRCLLRVVSPKPGKIDIFRSSLSPQALYLTMWAATLGIIPSIVTAVSEAILAQALVLRRARPFLDGGGILLLAPFIPTSIRMPAARFVAKQSIFISLHMV